MKNIPYSVGSPSREWEDTGHEEMNKIYESIKTKGSRIKCLDILNNLKSLLYVCGQALLHDRNNDVSCVLMINVSECIEELEEEIRKL